MAKLFSASGTLAASTDSLDAEAAFGADLGVEVMIHNAHALLSMTFVDTAGRSHVIPPSQTVVLPVDFRSGSITGTGLYYFFASTEAGFSNRQNIAPAVASGSITAAMITDATLNAAALKAAGQTGGKFASNAFDLTDAHQLDAWKLDAINETAANKVIADGALVSALLKDATFTATRMKVAVGGKFAADAFDLTDADQLTAWKAGGVDATAAAKIFGAGVIPGSKRSIESKAGLAAAADRVTSGGAPVATPFATKHTITANRLVVGSVIRISGFATVFDGANGAELQITPTLGSVAIGAVPTGVDVADNAVIRVEAEVVITAAGASGTFSGWSFVHISGGTPAYTLTHAGAIDTTADADVELLVNWNGVANDDVDLRMLVVEVIG